MPSLEGFASALLGERPAATYILVKHGAFWLSLSIVFDYTTSWGMMSLLGPSTEGSVQTSAFFETRSLGTLLTLLESQWPWIFFLGAIWIAFLSLRKWGLRGRRIPNSLKSLLALSIVFAWLMGAWRFARGPTSNIAAFAIKAYGVGTGDWIFYILFWLAGLAVAIDLIAVYARIARMGDA